MVLTRVSRLNLVVVRSAAVYGTYIDFGISTLLSSLYSVHEFVDGSRLLYFTVNTVLTVASVYGYLKKPMKSLYVLPSLSLPSCGLTDHMKVVSRKASHEYCSYT